MQKFSCLLVAASLALPAAAVVVPTSGAQARHHRDHQYREWRGRDGRTYCRKPDGTTGLIVGGVAGALLGRTIDSGGDRSVGTVLGAAGGALAGRAIERGGKRHCE